MFFAILTIRTYAGLNSHGKRAHRVHRICGNGGMRVVPCLRTLPRCIVVRQFRTSARENHGQLGLVPLDPELAVVVRPRVLVAGNPLTLNHAASPTRRAIETAATASAAASTAVLRLPVGSSIENEGLVRATEVLADMFKRGSMRERIAGGTTIGSGYSVVRLGACSGWRCCIRNGGQPGGAGGRGGRTCTDVQRHHRREARRTYAAVAASTARAELLALHRSGVTCIRIIGQRVPPCMRHMQRLD